MRIIGKTVKELREAQLPAGLRAFIDEQIAYLNEDGDLEDNELISHICGGDFYVIESVEDLNQIPTRIADEDGRWKTLAEVPDYYDACEWIQINPQDNLPLEEIRVPLTEDGFTVLAYVFILNCTNNAGGPVYIIPAAFVTDTVAESVALTSKFWSK